jgi:hypothetical protein
MLHPSALDAFIAGLSTAFFGSLVAGGAYLLRQQMALREAVATLTTRLEHMKALEDLAASLDPKRGGNLKSPRGKKGGDAAEFRG